MAERPFSPQSSRSPLKAVILAAGRGQRLREESKGWLKPLTPLLGCTLLERAVLSCRAAGVEKCYVVVGYGKEHILSHIDALAHHYRVHIRGVGNLLWEEGNGTSVSAAMPYVQEPFFLIMCDHVFDPTILSTLVTAGRQVEGCVLAVDSRIDQIFELEDATKVRRNGQAIVAIGKELTVYDAIDTGLFFCRPSVFQALEQARAAGDASLTGGIRRLISADRMRAVDIGNR
jgi:1L-myo-inositol 1-phosphate cytidylyltransferase